MKTKPLLFALDIQKFSKDDPEPKPEATDDNPPAPDKNLLEAYNKLKKDSVSRKDYEKVLEMNKQLLDASLNGGGDDPKDDKELPVPSIDELRADLYGPKRKELNDLDYWEKTLALRKAVMEQGKTDPMVPIGKDVTPTQADFATAELICSEIEECIKEANGDSAEFDRLLDKRIIGGLPKRKTVA